MFVYFWLCFQDYFEVTMHQEIKGDAMCVQLNSFNILPSGSWSYLWASVHLAERRC